jgi:DNA polymerase-3 subunit alpha
MGNLYYPHHAHLAPGSIGDSILEVSKYVQRAKEYGLKALTMTDHGSLSAMYAFYDECMKNDIKPIIGMEAYVAEDASIKDKEHAKYWHLILIAKDEEGMRNLFSIHNEAAVGGFYYRPRTDLAHLQQYGKGIIGSSACIAGEIPQAILQGETLKAIDIANDYKECFDEFYLELQPGSFEAQTDVNDVLVQIAEATGIPLLVTNDIHYLNEEDYRIHDLHVKLGRKMKVEEDDGLVYPDTCYWFMNREQVFNAFHFTDYVTPDIINEAIDNTEVIAEECNVTLSTKMHMPTFPFIGDRTEEQALYAMCFDRLGAVIEGKPNPQVYVDRLLYELSVIKEKGFCGYFLIVQDYVNWARDNGIPVGPGRGSAAGSLVSNVLGISQADPIKYGLMFERFLDPHREAVPDIDVDFDCAQRDRMFLHAVERYGYDHCALVSTLHMRKARGAMKDAARVLGYEPALGNEISKLIPQVAYGDDGSKMVDLDICDSIAIEPQLKEKQEEYPELFDLAIKLEGLPSSAGIHAAGIIISPVSLTDKLPLIKPNKEGVLATSLNLDDAENNFVKFDYLALATLAVIKGTENDVGWNFDYQNDDLLHDDAVWDVIGSRKTTGIFQIASKTYKDRMPRLHPRTIEELAACLALVRGPCISAKMDETYMRIVEGKEEVRLVHPIYDEITKETNGVLLYQEQIMQLAVAFGFDLTTGYRIVKAGAKKKFDVLKQYREEFLQHAAEHDVDQETTNFIFDLIVNSAQYSFNKSHAVSYAFITYVSAYLKVHFPMQFIRNLITNAFIRGESDTYNDIMNDCHRLGISFLPPSVNSSSWGFTIEDDKIRVGMCAIKGFGEKAAHQVLDARPFADLEDLLDKVEKRSFNKKVINAAIFSGLLDEFKGIGDTRGDLYRHYICDIREEEPLQEISIAKDLTFDVDGEEKDFEEVLLSAMFTTDPANDLPSIGWDDIKKNNTFSARGYIRNVKKIKTKTGKLMAFLSISTGDGTIDCTMFPNLYETSKRCVHKDHMCLFKGSKETPDSCILKEISLLD